MSVVTAKNEAKKVLDQFLGKNKKINLKKIAKTWGVKIHYELLDNETSGVLIVDNAKPLVVINSGDSKTRQKFTLAHELGHYHLHKPVGVHVDKGYVMSRNTNSTLGVDIQEIEANQFAAELLMPESLLKKDTKGFTDVLKDNDIEKLAKKYSVSVQAMTIRLSSMGMI